MPSYFGLFLAIGVLFGAAIAQSAEIRTHIRQDGAIATVEVIGTLQPGDALSFVEKVQELNSLDVIIRSVSLYSPGGSVNEGIKIGEEIRRIRAWTNAPFLVDDMQYPSCRIKTKGDYDNDRIVFSDKESNCICASACALAWIGGIGRSGIVGFHRSFLPSENVPLSYTQQEAALDRSRADILAYLRDNRAPLSLIDMIFSTSSRELKFVNTFSSEESSLRSDPVYEEYVISRCGKEGQKQRDLRYRLRFQQRTEGSLSMDNEITLNALEDVFMKLVDCHWSAWRDAASDAQLGR